MELGLAIALFVIISIVLAALFTLVSTYFGYRVRRALQNRLQPYALNSEPEEQNQVLEEAQYQQFIAKRKRDKQINNNKKKLSIKPTLTIQMANLNDTFRENSQNIYAHDITNSERTHFQIMPQSTRSIFTMRSFRPDRLKNSAYRKNSGSGSFNSMDHQKTPKNNSRKNNDLFHTFISYLVGYTEQGIHIIQNNVDYIWRDQLSGKIMSKAKCKHQFISSSSPELRKYLDVYGLEVKDYKAYQNIFTVDISKINPGAQYKFQCLKVSQKKQEIQFAEFYWQKQKLLD